jgi:hypothetical protein
MNANFESRRLAFSYRALGRLYEDAGRPEKSQDAHRNALVHQTTLSQEHPVADRRRRYGMLRALTLARLRDHTAATAEAAILVERDAADANTLYDSACVYALSAAAAGSAAEPAASYADRAMVLLRRAVARGFKDVKFLKQDADLGALHGRDDFLKLQSELAGSVP